MVKMPPALFQRRALPRELALVESIWGFTQSRTDYSGELFDAYVVSVGVKRAQDAKVEGLIVDSTVFDKGIKEGVQEILPFKPTQHPEAVLAQDLERVLPEIARNAVRVKGIRRLSKKDIARRRQLLGI